MTRLRKARWPFVVMVQVLVAFVVLRDGSSLLPGCISVEVSTSIEAGKEDVLAGLAEKYNSEGRRVDGRCVQVSVHGTTSGLAMHALRNGWESGAGDAPEPQIWTPTSSMWLELLRESGQVEGLPTHRQFESIAQSHLVVGMPEPMARELGWPEQQLSWQEIFDLSNQGWASRGHPEWGAFTFGKDTPHRSTSGLAATVATFSAAVQATMGEPIGNVPPEVLDDPEITRFVQGVEAGVHTYEEDIINFLRTLADYDAHDTPLGYVSAVLLQEQLLYDFNQGAYGPGGRPPDVKLVPFYPTDGTLRLDHPYVVLPSASAHQQEAAEDFLDYLLEPDSQEALADVGFRYQERQAGPWVLDDEDEEQDGDQNVANVIRGEPEVDDASLVTPPDGQALQAMLNSWDDLRKEANILLVLDRSSSMRGSLVDGGPSKLEIMQGAVQQGLDQLLSDVHYVGLWAIPSQDGSEPYVELVLPDALVDVRDGIETEIEGLVAGHGTYLFDTVAAAYDRLAQQSEGQSGSGQRIDAVIVLTDGGDTHSTVFPDLDPLLDHIGAGRSSRASSVMVFTIGFSVSADEFSDLGDIARATGGEAFDAADQESLDEVFLDVVDNF